MEVTKTQTFSSYSLLHGEDVSNIKPTLERAQMKFTLPGIQNKILKIMTTSILYNIQAQLQLEYFTLMINETFALSDTERVVLAFRWVDNTLSVHEKFIGF